MKIKIGDHVRFLNEKGDGRVVRILPGNLVEVKTPDGWDIPYPISELIVIPDSDTTVSYKPEPVTLSDSAAPKVSADEIQAVREKVFLIIAQDTEGGEFSGLRSYIVNDTMQNLDFVYYRVAKDNIKIEEKDLLEPGTKMFLDELNLEALSSFEGWHVQGTLHHPDQNFISPLINCFVPFQTRKFASRGAFVGNEYLHEDALVFPLITSVKDDQQAGNIEDLKDIILQKELENISLNRPKSFKSGKIDKPAREIDLHINQLVDSVVGLSNREILEIQMKEFHSELNSAVSSNENSIIFIHGIGNGTLKTELRKTIEREYKFCDFEDASFKEYGFGATLVRIRQNK